MPLTTCPDCGGPVSTQAIACPRCGRPNNAPTTRYLDRSSNPPSALHTGPALAFQAPDALVTCAYPGCTASSGLKPCRQDGRLVCSRHRKENKKGIYSCSMCVTQSQKRVLRWGYVVNILAGAALIGVSNWPKWGFLAPTGLGLVSVSLAVVLATGWFRGYERTGWPIRAIYWTVLAPSFVVLGCIIIPIAIFLNYLHSTSDEGVRDYWVGVVRDGTDEADSSQRRR